MSKADGSRYWRTVRCDGCEKNCRYSDFRVLRGSSKPGRGVFAQAMEMLKDGSDDVPEKWTYKKKDRGVPAENLLDPLVEHQRRDRR